MSDYTLLERALLEEQARLMEFCTLFEGLANKLFFPEEDFKSFTIVVGKHGDYLCIAKRFTGEEEDEVLFASATSPMKALFAMDDAVKSKQWRREKPWSPKK